MGKHVKWKSGRRFCRKYKSGANKYGPWKKCVRYTRYKKRGTRKSTRKGVKRTKSGYVSRAKYTPAQRARRRKIGTKNGPMFGPKAPLVPFSGPGGGAEGGLHYNYINKPLPPLPTYA